VIDHCCTFGLFKFKIYLNVFALNLLSLVCNGRGTFRSYPEAKFFNATLHQHQFNGEESASQTLRAELNKKCFF